MATTYPEGFEPISKVKSPSYPEGFEPIQASSPTLNQEGVFRGETPAAISLNNLIQAIPFSNAIPEFKAGMATGDQLTSDAVTGPTIGTAIDLLLPGGRYLQGKGAGLTMGTARALNTAFNPISRGLSESPKYAQAAGSISGGDLESALKDISGANPIQSSATIPQANTGISSLDTALNTGVNIGNEAVNQPFLLAGLDVGGLKGNLGKGTPLRTSAPIESPLSSSIRESAAKNVSQALLKGGGTKSEKLLAEKLTPEILNRPFSETFALTGKGLEDLSKTQKESAGEAIESFGKLEGNTNPAKFVDAFEKLKEPYIVEGKVIDSQAINRIQSLQDTFSQFGDSISDEGLRQIRRTFDKQIQESNGFLKDLNQGSELNLKKTAANEIRSLISEKNPDLAKINKQFNFWSNLEDVVSSTNTRVKPQSGFTSKLASMIGFATGTTLGDAAARAITGKLVFDAIRSPGWKLTSARIKNSIADAVASANPERIYNSLKDVSEFDVDTAVRASAIQPNEDQNTNDQLP